MIRPRGAAAAVLVLVSALVLAPASLPVASAATRAEDAVSQEAYRARVVRARRAVQAAMPRIGEMLVAGETASELIRTLPSGENVVVGDRVVRADSSALRALVIKLDVTRDPQVRRDIAGKLVAYLSSLEAAVPAERVDVPQDRAELRRLLGGTTPAGVEGPLQRLARWFDRLADGIRRWLSSAGAAPGSGLAGNVAWTLVVASLVALAGWVAYRVVRTWMRSVAARESAVLADLGSAPVVAAEAELPADPLAYADGLAAETRFREAVRVLFGAAARGLAEAGMVHRTRTRTNAELLAEIPAGWEARRPLRALVDAFESAWYGHADPGPDGFRTARETYGELMRHAAVGPRVPEGGEGR